MLRRCWRGAGGAGRAGRTHSTADSLMGSVMRPGRCRTAAARLAPSAPRTNTAGMRATKSPSRTIVFHPNPSLLSYTTTAAAPAASAVCAFSANEQPPRTTSATHCPSLATGRSCSPHARPACTSGARATAALDRSSAPKSRACVAWCGGGWAGGAMARGRRGRP